MLEYYNLEEKVMSCVIFIYTREQALADGVLVDVTQMARRRASDTRRP